MNLDNLELMHRIDSQNMLAEIDGLPDQLTRAYEIGASTTSQGWTINQVVIAGMGGSAIGADLLASYLADVCPVPIIIHRDYGLPAFAKGEETLVICSSHSGNTEETLDAFEAARKNGCHILVICTGGEIAQRADENKISRVKFEHKGQPRAAVGFSFGILLGIFVNLGLIPDQTESVANTVAWMKRSQQHFRAEVQAVKNPAKRYAGQLMGRWVTVFAAGMLVPVARRMKGQLNELAKAVANFEALPEADHNSIEGLAHPAEVLMPHAMSLFLRSPSDHPRNRARIDLTKKTFMVEGTNTDFIDARGDSPLANMWTMLHFGDYMAYYLAIAYGVNPTPVPRIAVFKSALKDQA